MAPSSSHSPSPLKKLLITDQKPRSKLNCRTTTAHPNSATAPPPTEKRTRDQPNLSDCHCCGRRVNDTDPKDRLQLLDSIWRIVLLCRKCRKDVRSGQTCPYCWKETGDLGDLFQCSLCERKIHRDCVCSYGDCAPWCYLGVRQENFKICADCWIPELLKGSFRVSWRSSASKGGLVEDKVVAKNVSKKGLKDTKCEVKKGARNAKEKGSTKAKRAKHVTDIRNVVLALEAVSYKDNARAENLSGTEVHVVDKAELEVKLDRTMDSSSRTLSSSDVLDTGGRFGLTYVRSGLGKSSGVAEKIKEWGSRRINQSGESGSCNDVNEVSTVLLSYRRGGKRKVWQLNDGSSVTESQSRQPAEVKLSSHSDDGMIRGLMKGSTYISEASLDVTNGQCDLHTTADRYEQKFVCYKRTRLKHKECQVNDPVWVCVECRSTGNNSMAFESGCCQSVDVKLEIGAVSPSDRKEFFPHGHCHPDRAIYQMECDSTLPHYAKPECGNQAHSPIKGNSGGGCNEKCKGSSIFPPPDHYRLKYTKRKKSSKSGSGTKLCSKAFFNEIATAVPGLATNDSMESRTLSDASFDSLAINCERK